MDREVAPLFDALYVSALARGPEAAPVIAEMARLWPDETGRRAFGAAFAAALEQGWARDWASVRMAVVVRAAHSAISPETCPPDLRDVLRRYSREEWEPPAKWGPVHWALLTAIAAARPNPVEMYRFMWTYQKGGIPCPLCSVHLADMLRQMPPPTDPAQLVDWVAAMRATVKRRVGANKTVQPQETK